MQNYQLLNWDSTTFGYSVARIMPPRLAAAELAPLLQTLKNTGVKLVYWAIASQDASSQFQAEQQQGLLVDHKITYAMPLSPNAVIALGQNVVEPYPASVPDTALEMLAFESGQYSRFKTDPNIATAIFTKIYSSWIANSVNRQLAQAVLTVQRNHQLAGMITLGDKNNRGDIGLLAVHPDYRGLKIGIDLVRAGQRWFQEQGYSETQVVTQAANKPACALYEKCGYQIEKVENFYHFWL